MMISDYDRVTDAAYLVGLESKPMDAVRAMRNECQMLENSASYVRRFVQGRLDLVASALGGHATGSPADISSAISASHMTSPANPRPPQDMSAEVLPDHLIDQLDSIIGTDELVDLSHSSPERLAGAFEELTTFEQKVSTDRRVLHEIIDRIQADIVRRYRDGEASVDGLLA